MQQNQSCHIQNLNRMRYIKKSSIRYWVFLSRPCSIVRPASRALILNIRVFLYSLLLLSCPVIAAENNPETLKIPAADFTLKSNTGKNIRLEELAGQVIFINFWASWCGPCREELPELELLYQRYKDLGFTILAISNDNDIEKAKKFFEPLNLSYPILFDNNQNVSSLYRVKAMPSSFLIDREGTVRYQHKGFKKAFINIYDAEIRELVKE